MSLTPEDVERKTFKERFKGYDMDEVDAFLDRVVTRLQELLAEQEDLRRRLRDAQHGTGESGELLQRTLLTAQRTADETVAEAKAEADRLLSEARGEHERLLATARDEAGRERERLQGEGEQLARAIEELRSFRARHADRLRSVLDEEAAALERTSAMPDVPSEIDELVESVMGGVRQPAGDPVVDLPPADPTARSVLDTGPEGDTGSDARAGE
jgi:cell division initiation protein